MSGTGVRREVEIKLRVEDAVTGKRLLRNSGFRIARRRAFEQNILFDTPGLDLRRRGALLRLRRSGSRWTVTFKDRSVRGKHKSREEVEVNVSDGVAFQAILERLGLAPVFRYEKYRTEFRSVRGSGIATLDETPIGVFVELEGSPAWIDRTARRLGFSEMHYITMSYGQLYIKDCLRKGVTPANMVFTGTPGGDGPGGKVP